MMKKNIYFYFLLFLISCQSNPNQDEKHQEKRFFFEEVKAVKSGNEDLLLPNTFSYQVLFQGGKDSVLKADGKKYISKGKNDMLTFIPINGSSTHGYLYTSHETFSSNSDLGDGGGASIMEIKKENDKWNIIGDIRHIDFSTVGETARNCGGTVTPKGTILTSEEIEPMSNEELSYQGKAFTDTSDLHNGMKAYQNQGWVVEVDPASGKALHKLYGMGRYSHEDVHCMSDGKTVYLSDDSDPAIFFKFVAKNTNDYTNGDLFAYRQSEDYTTGDWIKLPQDTSSLINARNVAIEMGATLFMRHEWMDIINGKLYIAETGKDRFEWAKYTNTAKPAKQFNTESMNGTKDGIGNDPYGRILVFDPSDNSMKPFLEGGTALDDSTKNFSNPDCIVKLERNGKNYLVMSEDLVGRDLNRISKEALAAEEAYCEIYFLDMDIENPSVDDLVRFAVSPNGAETTGDCFTPDGKTMFLNVQHPSSKNKAPFNYSSTIAIEGF